MRELKPRLDALAASNVFIGTSSWKYPGWCGQIYDEQRYLTRNKFSEKKFNETCLNEYAEVFKTVCVDAGYYKFPDERYLEKLTSQVPSDFKFSFKVTDVITIKRFPNHSKFGSHAGQVNRNFLNADLFQSAFMHSCGIARRTGTGVSNITGEIRDDCNPEATESALTQIRNYDLIASIRI